MQQNFKGTLDFNFNIFLLQNIVCKHTGNNKCKLQEGSINKFKSLVKNIGSLAFYMCNH